MSDPFELSWECTFTLVPGVMMWLSQVMWKAPELSFQTRFAAHKSNNVQRLEPKIA